MPETRAQRTLVKSPPELWAEISDPAALAGRLEAFGEIRITRLEAETTVAWEGDTARGTVALAPSGWGTTVTLTVETAEAGAATPDPGEAAAPAPARRAAPEPGAAEPGRATAGTDRPAAPPPRRRLLARLLARRRAARAAPADDAEPVAPPPGEPVAEPAEAGESGAADGDDAQALGALLGSVLDDLGFAHHRPFSRG